ncbi:membrane protein insertase YidC [Plantibacter sp. MCCC 1A11337]|uniref:YidC/Oxa1 family membrane protein insertase n=1 Tax=Plantibacter sp. MCCC 1A11337 TaxID=2736644 RepID=UPI001582648E|nr:membrane protein insertase YidC [Plantibacter sp. MCCC 1A11337]NUJ87834.1 membrane protein insertase YidC [Plantibacter sp. MCCC 1A11337]
MDLSTIPFVSTILDGLAGFVAATGAALEPFTGSWAPLFAIVVLTVLVRLLLLPVGVSQVRAERTRRRLAPELAALRKRYAGRPEELNRALVELYQRHGTSPVAGCLPLLAQAPVVSAVYALFVHQDIAGHANTLLSAVVGGVPLGSNLFQLIGTTVTAVWPFLVVLLLLALAIELTRRASARWTAVPDEAAAVRTPVSAGTAAIAPIMRWLPFLSVGFAAIVPFAAAVYLATSALWTVAERAVLRRTLRDPFAPAV